MASRKLLVDTEKIGQRQPGQDTVWGQTPQCRRDLGVGVCQWFSSVVGLVPLRLGVLGPLLVGWAGGTFGYWQYDREREPAAGDAVLGPLQGTPPPTS